MNYGKARPGRVGRGMLRLGKVRSGKVRRAQVGRGKARFMGNIAQQMFEAS